MMIGTSELARFSLLVLCLGIMLAVIAAAGAEGEKAATTPMEMTVFHHESGAVYLVRVGTVVAVRQPKTITGSARTEVLLQGGHVIRTTADIDQLQRIFGVTRSKDDK